jgi:exportin-1
VAATVKIGLLRKLFGYLDSYWFNKLFFSQMLPMNTNIREAYACGQDQEQNFIQNLAMFLCTYLKEHGALVEKKQLNEVLMKVRMLYRFGTVCIVYVFCVVLN